MDKTTTSQNGLGAIPSLPRFAYKIKEAAQICGVHPDTIRRAIARGLLKPSRKFRHALIPVDQLRRFVAGEAN